MNANQFWQRKSLTEMWGFLFVVSPQGKLLESFGTFQKLLCTSDTHRRIMNYLTLRSSILVICSFSFSFKRSRNTVESLRRRISWKVIDVFQLFLHQFTFHCADHAFIGHAPKDVEFHSFSEGSTFLNVSRRFCDKLHYIKYMQPS